MEIHRGMGEEEREEDLKVHEGGGFPLHEKLVGSPAWARHEWVSDRRVYDKTNQFNSRLRFKYVVSFSTVSHLRRISSSFSSVYSQCPLFLFLLFTLPSLSPPGTPAVV